MNDMTTLALPKPRLAEGRFGSCLCLTDEALFESVGVRVAFTERSGGVSVPPFDSLNLGGHVDDDASSVARNREILSDALGAPGVPLVAPRQVHGVRIVACASQDEAAVLSEQRPEADGVIVRCNDVAALLCFADCVPVIGVSPTGSFFVVHAGWRGAVGRIAERAVRVLCDEDGIGASRLNIYLGPYIHACHFEVGDDVRERFACEFGEECISGEGNVDLGIALRTSLVSAGVDPTRIADAGICTACDNGRRFYSYRASGGSCGRHGAFAMRFARKGGAVFDGSEGEV